MVVGDSAWIVDSHTDKTLPQLGSVALQSGTQAGANIVRRLDGKDTKPFDYKDKGTMATIGRASAVVQFKHGRTLKGKMASLAWGAVHLALLSTGEDRAKAVIDWTWAGFTHERSGRIVVDTATDDHGDPVPAATVESAR
jgi:NADH dehydrogenase